VLRKGGEGQVLSAAQWDKKAGVARPQELTLIPVHVYQLVQKVPHA
jgi:hypothetical protein